MCRYSRFEFLSAIIRPCTPKTSQTRDTTFFLRDGRGDRERDALDFACRGCGAFFRQAAHELSVHGQHGLALTARSVLTTKAKPICSPRVVHTSYCLRAARVRRPAWSEQALRRLEHCLRFACELTDGVPLLRNSNR